MNTHAHTHAQAFKDGDVRFLIATDVAARGIDISGLPYVVNVTLPDTAANYIHRIGRVGRADKVGLAISLVATEKVDRSGRARVGGCEGFVSSGKVFICMHLSIDVYI